MKRILLLALAFATLPFYSFATHLMGGEITAQHVSGNDYLLVATAYRDTMGIPMSATVNLTISDTAAGWDTILVVSHDTTFSGSLVPLVPYGTEIYIFADTFSFPASGNYHISFTNCCRNMAILNLANPGSNSMFLEAEVMIDTSNSSPYFLAPPISYLPVNTPWTYNPSPFDPDGDSLVWSLDTPKTALGLYCAGYTLPPDTSGNGTFSIDATTGIISYTASFLGNYVTTVIVEEYRNGVKIGEIRRDMQLIVGPSTNNIPLITNTNNIPTNNNGYYAVNLTTGQNFTMSILASDPDPNDVVSMAAFGAPFIYDTAELTVSPTGNGNEIEGIIDWTPSSFMANSMPYLMTIRVADQMYAIDKTILFSVAYGGSSIEEEATVNNRVFPNPSNGNFFIEVELKEGSKLDFSLFDVLGKEVHAFNRELAPGKHLINTQVDLPKGQYFLQVSNEHQTLFTQKLLMVK
jgi:hypothetical protein